MTEMTDSKTQPIAPAADRSAKRSALGRVIGRIGTHNFSLLIALVILIAIFGSLAPRCLLPASQHLQHRPGDRDPRHPGHRPDHRDHLGRPRYFGRCGRRHVDGLHCARRRLDGLAAGEHTVWRRGRRDRRDCQRADHHGRTDKRGDRHARNHGGVPWGRVHHLQRSVDQHLRPARSAISATASFSPFR